MDKAFFQHDMTYGKYKDLEKRTQSDKVLKDKVFEIANNPKYDEYQRGLASMVYKFFKMSQYFPPYRSSRRIIKMELDLSSYATKTDLKNVTHVDVSSFASKTNLSSLKNEVDKLDIDKLTSVPNDLAKLSNVVKNDVVKKTKYN